MRARRPREQPDAAGPARVSPAAPQPRTSTCQEKLALQEFHQERRRKVLMGTANPRASLLRRSEDRSCFSYFSCMSRKKYLHGTGLSMNTKVSAAHGR